MTILTTGAPNDLLYEPRTRPNSYSAPGDLVVGDSRLPVTRIGPRDALIDPSAMREDQPYGYRLDGQEYVVFRRAGGRLDFYELPTR